MILWCRCRCRKTKYTYCFPVVVLRIECCVLCVDLLPIRFSLNCDTIPVWRRVCMRARAQFSAIVRLGGTYKHFASTAWCYSIPLLFNFLSLCTLHRSLSFRSLFYCRRLLSLLLLFLPFFHSTPEIFISMFSIFVMHSSVSLSVIVFACICYFASHPLSESRIQLEHKMHCNWIKETDIVRGVFISKWLQHPLERVSKHNLEINANRRCLSVGTLWSVHSTSNNLMQTTSDKWCAEEIKMN